MLHDIDAGAKMPHPIFHWLPLAIFPIIVFGILVGTGHLTDGPQMVDDNQIYKLQIEFAETGFFHVLGLELRDRFNMRRLVPVYSVQKVVQARLFGGNLAAWSIATGLVGVCSAGLLYWFFRMCDGTILAALAFALISVVGEQSVLWWRMLHGEGIGMLLFSAALVLMAFEVRTGKRRYEIAFAVLTTLAMLSKESFILTIPSVLLLKVWLTSRQRDIALLEAAHKSWLSICWLSAMFIAALAIVKLVFATTTFNYAGWTGFDATTFEDIVRQYVQITNFELLVLLSLIFLSVQMFQRPPANTSKPAAQHRERKHRKRKVVRDELPPWAQRPSASLTMALVFFLLLTVPQLLLYMRTGMLNTNAGHFGRYILPCILGYAFLIAEFVRLIQQESKGHRAFTLLLTAGLCISVFDKGAVAYSEALAYANISRTTDMWFDSVVANTAEDSPIVLVFVNGMTKKAKRRSIETALRVYYILSQAYDRANVYYCPVPREPTIEESRLALENANTRHHARNMRTVE